MCIWSAACIVCADKLICYVMWKKHWCRVWLTQTCLRMHRNSRKWCYHPCHVAFLSYPQVTCHNKLWQSWVWCTQLPWFCFSTLFRVALSSLFCIEPLSSKYGFEIWMCLFQMPCVSFCLKLSSVQYHLMNIYHILWGAGVRNLSERLLLCSKNHSPGKETPLNYKIDSEKSVTCNVANWSRGTNCWTGDEGCVCVCVLFVCAFAQNGQIFNFFVLLHLLHAVKPFAI
jgi:hypothetical protein